jgi:hypothetical protein
VATLSTGSQPLSSHIEAHQMVKCRLRHTCVV